MHLAKQNANLAAIIDAAGIELISAGGERLKGLCPFHSEKTPSFFVFRDRQRFHCFGCGVGGDVIDFIQQHRGLSFREAMKVLGMENWQPSQAEIKRIKAERRTREALKWRERELAWTFAKAIRIAEKTLSEITLETLDDHALILQHLETLKYQHSIFIEGDEADRAALVDDLKNMEPFPRRLLFKKNFDYASWQRQVNRVEKQEPQIEENHRIKIQFG